MAMGWKKSFGLRMSGKHSKMPMPFESTTNPHKHYAAERSARVSRLGRALLAVGVMLAIAPSAVGADVQWAVENVSADSKPASFASSELRKYLSLTLGRDVTEGPAAPGDARIRIGLRTDLPEEDRARLPEPAEGFDGYAVSVQNAEDGPPTWIVAGENDRGVLYGVYDVLERVGWRWFHPTLDEHDPEVRPSTNEIHLAEAQWAVASPMRVRALIWYVDRARMRTRPPSPDALRAQIDWVVKTRHNTLEYSGIERDASSPVRQALAEEARKRGLLIQSPGHNFDVFLPNTAEAFAEHPEWFGERKGTRRRHAYTGAQFCWTNEGAIQEFIRNVSSFVTERPELDTLTLSPLDGGGPKPCECDLCTDHTPTDRYLALANQVAASLEDQAPDVTIEALVGYQHVADPPESVVPDERVRGRFAVWQRGLNKGYSTDRQGPKLAAWNKVFNGRLTAYQYYSDNFANPALASVYTKQMKSDREFIFQIGADGALNLLYPDDYWWRQTLNAYLAGRAFYDPAVDPDDLLRDYALRYHGPRAGPLMAEYYATLVEHPRIGAAGLRISSPAALMLLTRLRTEKLTPAAKLVKDDPLFHRRMTKALHWHEVAERTTASSNLIRRAQQQAKKRPAAAEATFAVAQKLHEAARTRADQIAALDQGVISPDFSKAYTTRFNAMIAAARRPAKKVRIVPRPPDRPNAGN